MLYHIYQWADEDNRYNRVYSALTFSQIEEFMMGKSNEAFVILPMNSFLPPVHHLTLAS